MNRFFGSENSLNKLILDGDEFNHAVNVLRAKINDQFILLIGDDYNYFCTITKINKNNLEFIINKKELNWANPKIDITIFQALIQSDRMEYLVQKTSEIGASKLIPIITKYCEVKNNINKQVRLSKIAISAAKQCGRSKPLEICDTININKMIEQFRNYDCVFFANEKENSQHLEKAINLHLSDKEFAIIIGPVGGFSEDEINLLSTVATSVTLGKRILRAETAPIFMTSVIVSKIEGIL